MKNKTSKSLREYFGLPKRELTPKELREAEDVGKGMEYLRQLKKDGKL